LDILLILTIHPSTKHRWAHRLALASLAEGEISEVLWGNPDGDCGEIGFIGLIWLMW